MFMSPMAIFAIAFITYAIIHSNEIKERVRSEIFEYKVNRPALPGPRPKDKPLGEKISESFMSAFAGWLDDKDYQEEWIAQLKRFENEPLYLGEILVSVAHKDRLRPDVMEVGYGITTAEVKQAIMFGLLPKGSTLPTKLTKSEADKWFAEVTLPTYERCVNETIKVPLTTKQRFALISFCHNLGKGNLEKMAMQKGRLKDSNYGIIAKCILRYTYAGSIKDVPGLVKRRNFEAELWQSGTKNNSFEVAAR
jgi:GH24 family phage-related lysozyme (muramidase)